MNDEKVSMLGFGLVIKYGYWSPLIIDSVDEGLKKRKGFIGYGEDGERIMYFYLTPGMQAAAVRWLKQSGGAIVIDECVILTQPERFTLKNKEEEKDV